MLTSRDPEGTRERLLVAAAHEIHRKGFRGASLNDILATTGLTKGALYHHFPNKQAVGLAVVDKIDQLVDEMWLSPLAGDADPLGRLEQILATVGELLQPDDVVLGCPLNNLAQELSAVDDTFRERVEAVYSRWRGGFAAALAGGQRAGTVRGDLDPAAPAAFLVAALAGGRGLAKSARDPGLLAACVSELIRYLESLRP